MKRSTKHLLLVLSALLFAATAQANISVSVGTRSAGFYYNSPAPFHTRTINYNCAPARQFRSAHRVRGATVFTAHTYDRRYRRPFNRRIVVAVPNGRIRARSCR